MAAINENRFEENSTFGPPSELLRAADFLADATLLQHQLQALPTAVNSIHGREAYDALSPDERAAIEEECRYAEGVLSMFYNMH